MREELCYDLLVVTNESWDMYLLNNEEDEQCVHIKCTTVEYEAAESQLLNTDQLRVMFCGHLYFAKKCEEDGPFKDTEVVEMTLSEYVDFWRPYVDNYRTSEYSPDVVDQF